MASTARTRTSSSRAASARSRAARDTRRASIVWSALVASMTLVGGGLWLAGSPAPALDVAPMMATATSSQGLEVILRTSQPITQGRWQAIVIHDSGSGVGTADSLDQEARRMGLRGLGHHFVVGNGNGMDDGELFVGERWMLQTPGAHTAGPQAEWFNRGAIGICLVGDGDRDRFSAAQTRRLHELVRLLCQRLSIPPERVYLHSQVAPTTSPGRHFNEAALRAALQGI